MTSRTPSAIEEYLNKDWEARLYSDFDAPMSHKDVAAFVRSMLRRTPSHEQPIDYKALYEAGCASWNPVYQEVLARAEKAEAALAARSSIAAQEPVAWLYSCFKPGKREVFASVDPDDTTHWPLDQWKEVKKEPLYLASLSATQERVTEERIRAVEDSDEVQRAFKGFRDGGWTEYAVIKRILLVNATESGGANG